jgi:hypothetical protein
MGDVRFKLFYNREKGTATVMDPETGQTVREATLEMLKGMSDLEITELSIFISHVLGMPLPKIANASGGPLFEFIEENGTPSV